ncbi:MAG: DciA family protein [Pseudomonadota bacterium]
MARSKTDHKPVKRTRRGFQRAAATARPVVDAIAGRAGFAEADVLLNWPDIVGTALSGTCQPIKVTYQSRRSLGASLIVQATSARAPEVEHRAPQIIERINQHYGYRAISRIKVTQSTGLTPAIRRERATGFAEGQTPFSGSPAGSGRAEPDTPTTNDATRAEALVADIQSPGLRAALARMGAHVIAQDRRNAAKQEDTP